MSNITDFIGRFDFAFSKPICEAAIEYYEFMSAAGYGKSRQELGNNAKLNKDNSSLFLSNLTAIRVRAPEIHAPILEKIWSEYFPQYVSTYASLESSKSFAIHEMKIQKTLPGQGYHIWHYENNQRTTSARAFNYQIYLNDVAEGGETEFLYYSRREKPQQGTLLIYPCGFTHTHRGNPPLSGTKYLLNGWIELE